MLMSWCFRCFTASIFIVIEGQEVWIRKHILTFFRWGEFVYPSSAVPPTDQDLITEDEEQVSRNSKIDLVINIFFVKVVSIGPMVQGSKGPKVQGSKGPMEQWTKGPLDHWILLFNLLDQGCIFLHSDGCLLLLHFAGLNHWRGSHRWSCHCSLCWMLPLQEEQEVHIPFDQVMSSIRLQWWSAVRYLASIHSWLLYRNIS